MAKTIVTLPGDGIGPEVTAAAVEVLNALRDDLTFEEHLVGGASIDAHGTALTDEVLQACRESDAVFLGAVGGPKWDTTDPDKPRPEQGLLNLRRELDLYANLRPVRPARALVDASPLRRERHRRAPTSSSSASSPAASTSARRPAPTRAPPTSTSTPCPRSSASRGSRSAPRAGASRASTRPTCSRRRACGARPSSGVHNAEFPDVELEHVLVDNAAMQLVAAPTRFDVILTDNMFGDILSDEAAMLTGSIGMLPSASLGAPGEPGMFEPVHGSAPDIAGKGVANPLAMFLSGAMLLRHGIGFENEAAALESAVDRALDDGLRTHDLGGTATTVEATRAVLGNLR